MSRIGRPPRIPGEPAPHRIDLWLTDAQRDAFERRGGVNAVRDDLQKQVEAERALAYSDFMKNANQ